MKKLEIKINHEPISKAEPFAWEVELLTETDHINKIQEHLDLDLDTTDYNTRRIVTKDIGFDENNIKLEIISVLEHNFEAFDQLYQFSHWNTLRSVHKWYEYNIHEQVTYNRDAAGFRMGEHVDNRIVFGAMIINLEDNDTKGTSFPYLNYTLSGEKNKGVFFLNHDVTKHEIWHTGRKDRYTLSTVLYLKQLTGTEIEIER